MLGASEGMRLSRFADMKSNHITFDVSSLFVGGSAMHVALTAEQPKRENGGLRLAQRRAQQSPGCTRVCSTPFHRPTQKAHHHSRFRFLHLRHRHCRSHHHILSPARICITHASPRELGLLAYPDFNSATGTQRWELSKAVIIALTCQCADIWTGSNARRTA